MTYLECDLCKASCSACVRAGVSCSGYRDPDQLQIRDESQKTKQKVFTYELKLIPKGPEVSISERARNAFFFRYISGFSTTYDVLGPLYQSSPWDGYLVSSVDAVSLAFFSLHFGCLQGLKLARQRYLDALSYLNKALVLPGSAKSDSTLLAVLLLDLFEKLTANSPRSTESWMSHVNGALALINLRENKQFENYVGLRLSVRLSINLLISCVAANAPVPSRLTQLRSEIEPFVNKYDPKWRSSGLIGKYANLRAALQDGDISTQEAVSCSTELEKEFVTLMLQMPPLWRPTTVYLERASPRVLDFHFDRYDNHFITQTCNVVRIMRIFLNDITRTIESSEVQTNTIDNLARDICATAPQFTSPALSSLNALDCPMTQGLRCYTLIFPLYVAGMYANERTKIRQWVIKELRSMANEFRIPNANIVANMLERADGTSPWAVYAMLGSYAFAA